MVFPRDVKDRVVQYPHRYKLVLVDGATNTFDLVPMPGTVTEPGTPINKAYLQPIENTIASHLADNIEVINPGQTTPPHGLPKTNFNATADPTANDDNTEGYSIGSIWINKTDRKSFICLDNTSGSAIWKRYAYVPNPLYYYKDGDENESITGGWVGRATSSASATKYPTYLECKTTGTAAYYATFYTIKPIDFSDISKLHVKFDVDYTGTTSYGRVQFLITTSNADADPNNTRLVWTEVNYHSETHLTDQILTINIPTFFTPVYIAISANQHMITAKIKEIWGE